ncbi:hypothetical protein H0G86_000650 [Trichoderma simmonsii]|uniref:Uncharacterized protein n=1 Tax=Trichoderma simmonsii TaxID=1491479 RepID=A0A8G0L017_9HYPO|nr:hypothetical protein H0G86_000650 [Trichoderma simmonsii]
MDALNGLILLYDWRRAVAKPNHRQPQEETANTAAGRTIASKQANNPPKSAPASCVYVLVLTASSKVFLYTRFASYLLRVKLCFLVQGGMDNIRDSDGRHPALSQALLSHTPPFLDAMTRQSLTHQHGQGRESRANRHQMPALCPCSSMANVAQ